MIVSHKHRFIFIKTRKTAGTSIEVYLSRFCGPDDIVTPIEPHVPPHQARNHAGFYNHMPASEIREKLPECWDKYFRFCVERNPWDKTLSFYHMLNVRAGGRLSFDQYLASGDWCIDRERYTEPSRPDLLLVDRVLRYEDLDGELAGVFARLGIPFDGDLKVRAKAEYRTDRRPYRELYTTEQARQVAEAFRWEIEQFGYAF